MTMMFLVAGAVLGLCVFLMFRRKMKREEKRASMEGVELQCPKNLCRLIFPAAANWKRARPLRGGDLFRCPSCRQTSAWDISVKPARSMSR